MQSSKNKQLAIESPSDQQQFHEYSYRWVIICLAGTMLLINGLLNNTVIPIAAKIASVYNLSDGYVSSPVAVSFLIYTLMNFPANHIIDKKGLRFSFLVGGGLLVGGAALYTMVNQAYIFVLIGAILVSMGQPFIVNVPSKIAAYWFLDKNRPFATSLMTGMMLICSGVGFSLPTVLVSEEATVTQTKKQIFYLYLGYSGVSVIGYILVFLFMRKQPPTPPSIGAQQQKTDIKQSFKLFKKDKNLWIFFTGNVFIFGTFQSFSSTINLEMKPYKFTDFQIALFVILILIMGVIGSIVWSIYLQKTTNYQLTIRAIPTISVVVLIGICIALNTGAHKLVIFVLVGAIGFSATPIMPISYDLGCELSFPVGEAQVIGFLNGGAMIFAFAITLILTSAVEFKTASQSFTALVVYIVLVAIGTVFFYLVKIDLKRRRAEREGRLMDVAKVNPQEKEALEKGEATTDKKQKNAYQIQQANYMKINQEYSSYA